MAHFQGAAEGNKDVAVASGSSLRRDAGDFCSADVGELRNIADTSCLEDCATKASEWGATFATTDSAVDSLDFCGAIIPSFSSDSSSFSCCELPFPSASKPVVVTDTADSDGPREKQQVKRESGLILNCLLTKQSFAWASKLVIYLFVLKSKISWRSILLLNLPLRLVPIFRRC